jgi:hypothetical protein
MLVEKRTTKQRGVSSLLCANNDSIDRHVRGTLHFFADRMSLQLSSLDNEELIHDAVRQGHHLVVEDYVNKNPQRIDKVFRHKICQWRLLIAACFIKHEAMIYIEGNSTFEEVNFHWLLINQSDFEANGEQIRVHRIE